MLRALAALLAFSSLGCANGETFGSRRDGGGLLDARTLDVGSYPTDAPGLDAARTDAAVLDAGRIDGSTGVDAGGTDARASDGGRSDTGGSDAGRTDAGTDAPAGGGDLDPRLDTPPAGNPSCSTPGGFCSAPGGPGVCRFYSSSEGRCESCTDCGNLGASCSDGSECDILFACFSGRCTNICPLGTFYCGPIEDCLDVGHPTHGVCRP